MLSCHMELEAGVEGHGSTTYTVTPPPNGILHVSWNSDVSDLEDSLQVVYQPSMSVPQVISSGDKQDGEESNMLSEEQSTLGNGQHVLVAVSGGVEGGSAGEVVEVNINELLSSSMAFICQDKKSPQNT